jgi:hypothetical protein
VRGGRRCGTVSIMSSWRIGNATLSFHVPVPESIEHIENRESSNDETQLYSSFGDDGFANGDATYHSYDPVDRWNSSGYALRITHRLWWWHTDSCTGGYECACGPLTLLEALERLEPVERGTAVRLHAEEMRSLYDHFWSGQGLVSGASSNIGNACVSCIAEGAVHVWNIYEDACLLAEEFGEALAAYAYELMVGEPRFQTPSTNHSGGSETG